MGYADQAISSRRSASVGGVVLIHLAIGYSLVTGLAYRFIPRDDPPMVLVPLPPLTPPAPLPKTQPKPTRPDTVVKVLVPVPGTQVTLTLPPADPTPTKVEDPPAPPKPPALSRGLQAKGDRPSWVTPDDYPSASIRDGEEGPVAISVRVGVNGRVTSCQVTASSGHPALDEATCRYYTKRAKFAPALAQDGTAVEASYADRVRWQLPAQ